MNKYKFILLSVWAVMAIAFSSCEDDLVKSEIDAQNEGDSSKLPTLVIGGASNVTYENADITATITISSNTDEITSVGFVYSTDQNFTSFTDEPSSIEGSSISASLGVVGSTTYYVKSYAVTKNNGVAYSSDTISFTTPEAPVFEDTYLFGTYTAYDYSVNGSVEGPWTVTIQQKTGFYNKILITNIWDTGRTIEATVDFENKTITTDVNSIIYVDDTYGNCWMWGAEIIDGVFTRYPTAYAIATYDSTGKITFGPWAARVDAGSFGNYLYSELEKQ